MRHGWPNLVTVLLAALVVTLSVHLVVDAVPTVGVALAGEDDSDEGDDGGDDSSASGQIDCSIPDSQDDTGCDRGDSDDNSAPAPPAAPVTPAAQPPPRDTDSGPTPRGSVPTGAGGTAR
jgi:hypothetical protein